MGYDIDVIIAFVLLALSSIFFQVHYAIASRNLRRAA